MLSLLVSSMVSSMVSSVTVVLDQLSLVKFSLISQGGIRYLRVMLYYFVVIPVISRNAASSCGYSVLGSFSEESSVPEADADQCHGSNVSGNDHECPHVFSAS